MLLFDGHQKRLCIEGKVERFICFLDVVVKELSDSSDVDQVAV